MTTRPGVEIVSRSAPPTRGAVFDTGTAFFAGLAEKGPSDSALLIHNMSDFENNYGGRTQGTTLYDACDAAFRLGAAGIYVGRAVGPAAAKDTVTLKDAGAADSIAVDSIGPGASGLKVAIIAGNAANTFRLQVSDATSGTVLETTTYDLATEQDAVDWSSTSSYVRVRALGANPPAVVAATALAGGTDDRANITDVQRQTALNLFTRDLGPGQIAYPGSTTTPMYVALLNTAQAAGNKFALLDAADTSAAATLTTAADAIRSDAGLTSGSETWGMLVADWQKIAGIATNTRRTIPPSAIVAGLIAASDGRFQNPNMPAAGANGQSGITLALNQPAWSDTDRQSLNDKGVNVFRDIYGSIRLYGFRTLADTSKPDSAAWESASAARLRMAIQQDLDVIAEQFVFAQLDGRGKKVAEFNGACTGVLQGYWSRGSLYGDGATDAFSVDTGSTVNTPATLANNELHAVVGLRVSPFAELVYIEIVKVPISQSL